jgi:hypothetical protein
MESVKAEAKPKTSLQGGVNDLNYSLILHHLGQDTRSAVHVLSKLIKSPKRKDFAVAEAKNRLGLKWNIVYSSAFLY